MIRRSALLLPLLLAACDTAPRIAAPRPEPAPPVLAPPAPAPVDWTDAPLVNGRWTYLSDPQGSIARFGPASGAPLIELHCKLAERQIALSAPGTTTPLTLTTSSARRALAAGIGSDGRITALLAARDPLLDQLAFSRARFEVEMPGSARLIVPVGGELVRVIEDCRA